MELREKCKQIMEIDTFYYAVPLPEKEEGIDDMWQVDNFLTSSDEPGVQTIDFDCVVCVKPTSETLEELRLNDRERFDEILRISTKDVGTT